MTNIAHNPSNERIKEQLPFVSTIFGFDPQVTFPYTAHPKANS